MIVVSDTTPLNYLVLIDAVDVLPKLFEVVYTPATVLRGCQSGRPLIASSLPLRQRRYLMLL